MEYILSISLFVAGFFIAWFIVSRKQSAMRKNFDENEKKILLAQAEAEKQRSVVQETLRIKTEELQTVQRELGEQIKLANNRAMETATLKTQNENLLEKLSNQKQEIEVLQKRLTTEFENIASKILKERSDEFSASNHKNLSEILNPLKERIQDFEKKVDETYKNELRDNISLKEEVRKLTELNARVSEEANNLAKALKGDVKKQGNWGEVVLERVLERSG